MTRLHSSRLRTGTRWARPLALALLLWSCDGSNGWTGLPTGTGNGNGRTDTRAPGVDIQFPDVTQRVAVQDSVLVRVRVTDDLGVDSLVIGGFSRRGNPALGTDTAVTRFVPKVVLLKDLAGARDTVVSRYLLPTADSLADSVYIFAVARDSVGNVRADTVKIDIGGPRVQIREPGAAADVRGGTRLKVRVAASDPTNPLKEVTLRLRNAATNAVVRDTTLQLNPPLATLDSVLNWTIPLGAPAESRLQAVVRTVSNDSAVSAPTALRVLGAAQDARPPVVTFSATTRSRVEVTDTVVITVAATDSTQVSRVGATVRSIHRPTSTATPLTTLRFSAIADSASFAFTYSQLGLATPLDTSTVRIEVTAFAYDTAGNCATATVPRTGLSEGCSVRGDTVFSTRAGARTDVQLVRGGTVRPLTSGDRLVDLAADSVGRRLFVSNFSQNRVEILPFGASAFSGRVDVRSEPWGLAISANRDTLFAANSAGTNISVIPLALTREVESVRIAPADLRLYGVEYDVEKDSVNTVTQHDYSDRPQFLGQISSGQLIYSTKPTPTEGAGTIRILDRTKDQTRAFNRGSEIFTGYARDAIGKGIVVNALSAGVTLNKQMVVCPRRRLASQVDPGCVVGTATVVRDAVATLHSAGLTDTRVELGRDIASIALTDTTFVAVSRDNSAIAFGEGAVDPGRVFFFEDAGGVLQGSSSETEDLIGNAAERVTSLALNGDGTLGVARGRRAYFFDDDLRLEGQTDTGSSSAAGGTALHPLDANFPADSQRRRAFVTGLTADDAPYIDVIDTYTFRSIRRVFIRDQIVGPVIAVPVVPGDADAGTATLRLFGITRNGVVQVTLTAAELQ